MAATQSMAVPAYFYPGTFWGQLDQAGPGVGVAVMNPNSGAGTGPDPQYVEAVRSAEAAGITVVGYVYTSYGIRSLAAVESEVDNYYSWYPGLGGIFFDEASTDCANEAYYATLNSYVKSKGRPSITVLNPGTQTNQCYEPAADILVGVPIEVQRQHARLELGQRRRDARYERTQLLGADHLAHRVVHG